MEIAGKYDSDEMFRQYVNNYLHLFGPEHEIVVWGSGKSCQILIDTIEKTHRIKYIVDRNDKLWGRRKDGYEIKSPENLRLEDPENVRVIIMPYGFERYDIADVLLQMGFENECYCFGNEYLVLHHFRYNNRLVLQNIGFFIGSACTLRCRDCIAHLPLYAKNRNTFIPFAKIKDDIDRTFKTIDFINLITLSTGEIFLHPEINEIFEHLYTYRDRYNFIQTPTNGTILPKHDTLEVMKRCNIGVYISDYSHSIGNRSRIPELKKILDEYGILYEVFCNLQGGRSEIPVWSDIGDFSVTRNRSDELTALMFQRCANRAAQIVFDGKIYTCGSAPWGEFGGLYKPEHNSDFTELFDNRTAILRVFFGATISGYPNVCTRCDGIGPYSNPKTVKAGEQADKMTVDVNKGIQSA